ncbi:MAG: hypothetical protein EpisKO_15140 [Epibacterium sp.]
MFDSDSSESFRLTTYIGLTFDLQTDSMELAAGTYEFSTDTNGEIRYLGFTDRIAPELTPPSDQSATTDAGQATASLNVTSLGSASDNADSSIDIAYAIGSTTITGSYDFPVGETTVTMSASDAAGNDATPVTFKVVVSDEESPALTAPSNQEITTESGASTASLDVTDLGSVSDNVDSSLSITYYVGSAALSGAYDFPLGDTTVTMMASDAAGNSAQDTFTVTVNPGDATAPVLTAPSDQTAATAVGASTAALDVTSLGSGSDNLDDVVTIIYKVGDTVLDGAYDFPIGETTVTMDATDAAGNAAAQVSFTVTITPGDATAPVLTAPSDQTAATAVGASTAALDVTSLGSGSDNLDDVVTIIYKVGDTVLDGAYDFPIGETTVTMDATDAAGNAAAQVSFTVTITPGDATAPVLTAPSDQTAATAVGASTAALDVTSLGSGSDNLDDVVTIIYKVGDTVLDGAYDFPIGETTVTMDATDVAGNAAAQVSFTVTITPGDATAPVLTAPSDQTAATAVGASTAALDVTSLGSGSDNLDDVVTITYKVGDTVLDGAYDFPIGETTVTMDATDAAGNAAAQVSFTVTITPGDATAPVLTAPSDQTASTEPDATTTSLDVTSLGSGSDDIDDSVTIIYKVGDTVLDGAYDFPIGETTVTMDATDVAGNDAVQVSFVVTVLDGTPPPEPTITDVVVNDDKTLTVTGTAQAGATVTVTFPDGSTVETTASGAATSAKGRVNRDSTAVFAAATGTYTATSATPQTSGDVSAYSSTTGGGASASASVAVDATSPDVVLSGGPSDGISANESFTVTATFNEVVTGFSASDVVAQNASVTAVTGSGSDYTISLRATGAGTVTVEVPAGAAEDAASNPTNASNTLVFDDTTVVETQKQIAGFLYNRANQLISNQPELIGFLSQNGIGSGTLDAYVTRGAGNFNLASRGGLPVWFRLQGSWSEDDTTEARYAFGAVGGHLTLSDRLLVGAMLQFDHLHQDQGSRRVEGTGWMVGPYAVAQISDQALYVEGRVLYGQSSNKVAPFGTYEDSFDTTRVLAQLRVAGDIKKGDTIFTPYIDAAYANEEQDAYVDSLGNSIGAQKIHLRQASFGVGFATPLPIGAADQAVLTGGLAGVWSSTSGTAVADTVLPSYAGWRAKLDLGLRYAWENGSKVALSARYDGLGSAGYKDVGLSLDYSLKF